MFKDARILSISTVFIFILAACNLPSSAATPTAQSNAVFTAAALTYATGSPWIGLLGGMAAGLAIASIHAVACIRFRADQVVTGTAINILMIGVPGFLSGAFFLSSGSTPQIPKEQLIPNTPIVIAFLLVAITWYVLYRTPFGLRLRSVGENPEAADAAGVRVARM